MTNLKIKSKGNPKGIYIFLAIATVGTLIFGTLQRLPKSEAYYVTGTVISKNALQGYGPSGDSLVVKLENGIEVKATNTIQTGARTGDIVKLSGYERYLFGPRFQYVSKIQSK